MRDEQWSNTPTGVHFDCTAVRLNPVERDLLYAIAEHHLLRTPCARVEGNDSLIAVADRLVRRGFVRATRLDWSDGALTVCGRVTEDGQRFLTRAPLMPG
jgi:hypothetical protein